MSEDIYTFGQCKGCNRYTCLKNEYCQDCQDKIDISKVTNDELFKTLFGDIFKGDK